MTHQAFSLEAFRKRHQISRQHTTLQIVSLLRDYCTAHTWLAGGSVMSFVQSRNHSADYDFFFSSAEALVFLQENLEGLGATKTFESEHALTYTLNTFKIQLIKRRYYVTIEDIFLDFDLTISMLAIPMNTPPGVQMQLLCGPYSLWDLSNKEIRIQNVNSLGHTFKRVIKYGAKGFKIPSETYTNLMEFFTLHTRLDVAITEAVATSGAVWDGDVPPGAHTVDLAQIGTRHLQTLPGTSPAVLGALQTMAVSLATTSGGYDF